MAGDIKANYHFRNPYQKLDLLFVTWYVIQSVLGEIDGRGYKMFGSASSYMAFISIGCILGGGGGDGKKEVCVPCVHRTFFFTIDESSCVCKHHSALLHLKD